ncbi:unnamed protein product [Sympodiomycopsis kandeliae]
MSYAAAAEKNSQGGGAKPSNVDSGKVNVIPSDSDLEHLKTETAEAAEKAKTFAAQESKRLSEESKKLGKDISKRADKAEKSIVAKAKEASAQIQEGWAHLSSDPKAWGTLLGAVNIALLGGLGYFAYTERNNLKSYDRRALSAGAVGVLGLLGGQGYLAAETARKQQKGKGKK